MFEKLNIKVQVRFMILSHLLTRYMHGYTTLNINLIYSAESCYYVIYCLLIMCQLELPLYVLC